MRTDLSAYEQMKKGKTHIYDSLDEHISWSMSVFVFIWPQKGNFNPFRWKKMN